MCLNEIETILKKYEITDLNVLDQILENQRFLANHDYSTLPREDFDGLFNELRDKRNALEIIKREPNAVIETITTYDTWEEYIKDYPISDRTIWHIIRNKTEFDLLKEALLWHQKN